MKQYIVDAFTETLFKSNPAAVYLVDAWSEDSLMQAIAKENALSETAFLLPKEGSYGLRWFTPKGEIDLYGHATLTSAFVANQILHRYFPSKPQAAGSTSYGETASMRWISLPLR